MPNAYFKRVFTTEVLQAQQRLGSFDEYARKSEDDRNRQHLTATEIDFIGDRASFYLATISSDGWPYIQFKGGPLGFASVRNGDEIWFADFPGNRQYITLGNIAVNPRAALFFMDYANRKRLKLIAHLTERAGAPYGTDANQESVVKKNDRRFLVAKILAFDWNCPQYITRLVPAEELEKAVALREARIAELELRLLTLERTPKG